MALKSYFDICRINSIIILDVMFKLGAPGRFPVHLQGKPGMAPNVPNMQSGAIPNHFMPPQQNS